MPVLVGTPSDDVPEILATGRIDITTAFVSMTARHPRHTEAKLLTRAERMDERAASSGTAAKQ